MATTYKEAVNELVTNKYRDLLKENKTLRTQLERAQADNSRLIKIIENNSARGNSQ